MGEHPMCMLSQHVHFIVNIIDRKPLLLHYIYDDNHKAIMGGVCGFWGGVFSMGFIYLFMVEILYYTCISIIINNIPV